MCRGILNTQAQKIPKKKKKLMTTKALPEFLLKLLTPPLGTQKGATRHIPTHMMTRKLVSDQLYKLTIACHSEWLNTNLKYQIH
jgi:hypothetical protein